MNSMIVKWHSLTLITLKLNVLEDKIIEDTILITEVETHTFFSILKYNLPILL